MSQSSGKKRPSKDLKNDPSTSGSGHRDISAEQRVGRHGIDPNTLLTDFDEHNPDVAPWEARANARVEAVTGRRPPPIQPPPQSPYVRLPRRHSPDDLTNVTNTMGSAAIAAPFQRTIEKGGKASNPRALENLSKGSSAGAPLAKFDTAKRDLPAHSPIASARESRAQTPEQEAKQSRIPIFDGKDWWTTTLWKRSEDWKLATMYAKNRGWTEINLAFAHISPGAARERWKILSIDPEYAWAEPERQRRIDEEKMTKKKMADEGKMTKRKIADEERLENRRIADEEKLTKRRKADEERMTKNKIAHEEKMTKKRKADEEKQKQALAQKGDKPSSSGGHKRGKH